MAAQPPEQARGGRREKAREGRGVSARTWDILLFAAALLCAAGFARYYVRGVLDGDRMLARAAAVGFFFLCAAAVVSLLKVLA